MNDETIELAARGIAQFMLFSKKMTLETAKNLITKNGSKNIILKLLNCQSEFLGPTPRTVGVDLVSEVAAAKIQKSLDVKHIKKQSVVHDQLDRIRPQLKIDLAHSHPNSIWVRFYSTHENITDTSTTWTILQRFNILKVCDKVYEAYGTKDASDVFRLMTALEKDFDADLIFCSELALFLEKPLLFLSNYVKFMWCYTVNRHIFDPHTASDIRTLVVYMTYGLMFLNTNNLTNMPQSTHGPLTVCTGERPKNALSKFNKKTLYINEGSRALQIMNKASDFGTCSNYIEVISEVELDNSKLDIII